MTREQLIERSTPGGLATLVSPRPRPESVLTPPPASPRKEAAQAGKQAGAEPQHEIAVIVLTQSDRPTELTRALASVRAQRHVDSQLLLVVNGAPVPQADPCNQLIVLPHNAGIPGGRNIGAAAADARLLMFLDDDAELLDPDLLAAVVDRFEADPELGAMSIRLIDEEGRTQQRHVPRLGARSAERSGAVTHFVGAACVVRAETFHGVHGFDPRFFYSMEESDLAWRLLDAGWSIWYSADLQAFHPHTKPSRHHGYVRLTARNRLWMAWRSLPAPPAGHLPDDLDSRRGAPGGAVARGARRLPVGVVCSPPAASHAVAHRRADDAARPTPDRVTAARDRSAPRPRGRGRPHGYCQGPT